MEKVCISSLLIEGFKSFHTREHCGPFDHHDGTSSGSFIAVVGPNGLGKSVIGEAIAFALGGNRKTMRAKSLSSLINCQTPPSVGATVILSLKGQRRTTDVPEIVTLDIERSLKGPTLDRLNSKTRVRTKSSMGDEHDWQEVSEEEIHSLLMGWGVDNRFIARIIVTQNRHAIDASDPLSLLSHLELLLGTSELVEMIKEKEGLVRSLVVQIDALAEERARDELRRKELIPMIIKCQELKQMQQHLRKRSDCLREEKIKIFSSMAARCLVTEQRVQADVQSFSLLQISASSQRSSFAQDLDFCTAKKSKAEAHLTKYRKDLSIQTRDLTKIESLHVALNEDEAGDAALQNLLIERHKAARARINELAKTESRLNGQRSELSASLKVASLADEGEMSREERERVRSHLRRVSKKQEKANEDLRGLLSTLRRLREARDRASSDLIDAAENLRVQEVKARARAGASGLGAHEDIKERLEGARIVLVDKRQKIKELQMEIDRLSLSLDGDNEDGDDEVSHAVQNNPLDAFVHQLLLPDPDHDPSSAPFLGRLRDVFYCPSRTKSVNVALSEVCRLGTSLIVRDRATAHSTMESMRGSLKGFSGTITCLVLDEVRRDVRGEGGEEGEALVLPGGVQGLRVSRLIRHQMVHSPKNQELPVLLDRLLESLVGSWAVVEDAEAATRVLSGSKGQGQSQGQGLAGRVRQGRVWDIVAEKGCEVFRRDGEIVLRPRQGGEGGKVEYGLEASPGHTFSNLVSHSHHSEANGIVKRRKQDVTRLGAMNQEMAVLLCEVQKCEREISRLSSEYMRQHSESIKSKAGLDGARKKVEELTRRLAEAEENFGAEEQRREEMERQSSLLEEEKRQLEERLGGQASESDAIAMERLDSELSRVMEEMRQAQAQVSYHSTKLEVYQKTEAKKIKERKDKKQSLEGKRVAAFKNLAAIEGEIEQLSSELKEMEDEEKELRSRLRASNDRLKEVSEKMAQAKLDLEALERKKEWISSELNKISKAKGEDQLEKEGGEEDQEEEAVVMHRSKKQKRRRGRGARFESIEGEEGSEDRQLREEQEAIAWIEEEDASLDSLQGIISHLGSSVDLSAVKEDEELASKVDRSSEEQKSKELELKTAEKEKASMEEERYLKVSAALSEINLDLSRIFRVLSGTLGDANLSYNTDKSLLFSTGVNLNVRPDDVTRWQALHRLSGGQASLATLALALAAQTTIPCPFYFFDEIDAALDTMNASRVASFLESCSQSASSQFIVVSHRPQVFERAGCLVGVYGYQGSSLIACYSHSRGPSDLILIRD